MSKVLFVDDDLNNVEICAEILQDAGHTVGAQATVEGAIEALHHGSWDLVVMDLFIPLGEAAERVLSPRARRMQEHVQHLGGLVLLDELDRMADRPRVVSHTACTDHVLLELFGDRVHAKIPKPAPLDTLLQGIMEALGLHR